MNTGIPFKEFQLDGWGHSSSFPAEHQQDSFLNLWSLETIGCTLGCVLCYAALFGVINQSRGKPLIWGEGAKQID